MTNAANQLDRASWVTPQVLALLVRLDPEAPSPASSSLLIQRGERTVERGARWFPCWAAHDEASPARGTWVLTVNVPVAPFEAELEAVTLRRGEDAIALVTPGPAQSVVCKPSELGAACRAECDSATRERLHAFLAAIPAAHRLELSPALAAGLSALRDGLREPLPGTKFGPGPCAARLEGVIAIDDHGFWLTGWVHDAAPDECRFTALSPEGSRHELPVGAVTFHPRPRYSITLEDDGTVSTLGYYAYVELEHPSRHPYGWVMEFRTAAGRAVEHALHKPVETDAEPIWTYLQTQLDAELQDKAVLEHQVVPAISRLRNGNRASDFQKIHDFGNIPATPEVSIVIAVREVDRIQHQLIAFACDPEISRAELIYVASASDVDALLEMAEGLHDLHGLPFRLAIRSHPARRAAALNLGASLARAPMLVLMSGDVFPAAPGWLEQMRACHAASSSIAAVGPKLLHEDDSIAHAGAGYIRRASGRWHRTLPFAGLTRKIAGASFPRPVDAVSDACMMIAREVFRASGGFSDLYLEDGDEAGDLCLRLAGAAEVWYVPDVELYLLEEFQVPGTRSQAGARFNDWLFEHRCGARLAAIAGEEPAEALPPRQPRLPTIPAFGSGRPGAPVEILEVVAAGLDGSVVLDAALIPPGADDADDLVFEDTYSLVIDGWAIPSDGGTLTIEISERDQILWRAAADIRREDVAAKYPDTPAAVASGFQFVVGSLALPVEFQLEIAAARADGTRAPLGRVRGRRRRLRSGYTPRLQPLLITTIGRSGSSWLLTLVSRHPQVIALRDPGYEPMLTNYTMAVLRTLAEPASYMMALVPQINNERWWLGDGRPIPLPLRKLDPAVARWLGCESVEVIAGLCQSRFDSFYQALAHHKGSGTHRYFAEKTPPGSTSRLISELYPDGREIILVRDFRDMACSILDYNARRGFELWGRGDSTNDGEWLAYLRGEAIKILDGWRERRDCAHLVRYEDLMDDPAGTLDRLFSYLGVDADDETIERSIAEAAQTFPDAQAAHRTSPSFEASIGRWKHDLSPERQALCADAFDDILVEFGYDPTNDATDPAALPNPDQAASAP